MRISVLGPLEVSDAAGRPVRVGGHRVRALLILLALDAGRVIPTQALIERLWPEDRGERPAGAANALQSLVSRLRAALRQAGLPEGVLESATSGYRLAIPPGAVDAIAFEEQARAGGRALARGDASEAASLLRGALDQWRGSALTDVAGEQFAFAPAARLAELRAIATLDRIEADLVLGSADAAIIGQLRELTAADPLQERQAALLMRALAATGRQSEALSVYQRTREHLADRLGVDPSQRLEQAYLAILRQEIPQAAAARPARPATAGAADRSGPDRSGPDRSGPDRSGPGHGGPGRAGAAATRPARRRDQERPPSPDELRRPRRRRGQRPQTAKRRAPGHAHRPGRRRQDAPGDRDRGAAHRPGLVRGTRPGHRSGRGSLRGPRRTRPPRAVHRPQGRGHGGRPARPPLRRPQRPRCGAHPRQLRARHRRRRHPGGAPAARLPGSQAPRHQP
jgi:DNA-binding SARP family transcriptional activator